jgi:hypothetical protein
MPRMQGNPVMTAGFTVMRFNNLFMALLYLKFSVFTRTKFMGDTIEEIWRTPYQTVAILKHPGGLKQIGVEEVSDKLGQLLQK